MGVHLSAEVEARVLQLAGLTPAAPSLIDDGISEKDFQADVEQYARSHGWRCYHTRDSRRSVAGFPDLVLLRGGEEVIAELKVGDNRTDAAQDAWLDAFREAGRPTFVWYPRDWKTIEEVLQ
jgi:hypothetical protein